MGLDDKLMRLIFYLPCFHFTSLSFLSHHQSNVANLGTVQTCSVMQFLDDRATEIYAKLLKDFGNKSMSQTQSFQWYDLIED